MKPSPRIVIEVCSVCGLDWNRHGASPTEATCVRLLLDEVRSLHAQLAHRPFIQPLMPAPLPWRPHYPRPYWPTWSTTTAPVSPPLRSLTVSHS